MKVLYFNILLTLTLTAHSETRLGTPGQDPLVASLRDRFQKAGVPAADYLLKNKFNCRVAVAKKGVSQTYTHDLNFRQDGGLVTAYFLPVVLYGLALTSTGSEIIGTQTITRGYGLSHLSEKEKSGDYTAVYAIRVDKEGFLVNEYSLISPNGNNRLSRRDYVVSLSFPKAAVQLYTICQKK